MIFRLDRKQTEDRDRLLVNTRFSLALPADWQDQSVYRFEGPLEDGILHNIVVTVDPDPEPADLDGFARVRMDLVEKELQGLRTLKKEPTTLAGGLPAFDFVYRWTPLEDREIYQRALYVVAGGMGYVLTSTFSKKTWKTLGPLVDGILRSFAPEEEGA